MKIANDQRVFLLSLLGIALAAIVFLVGSQVLSTQQAGAADMEPLSVRIHVEFDTEVDTLTVTGWTQRELQQLDNNVDWAEQLQVHIVLPDEERSNLPAVIGDYHVQGDKIMFQPRYGWTDGESYIATLNLTGKEPLSKSFFVPAAEIPIKQPQVTAIYPTADQLPENLLRFYVEFSVPMQRGNAYDIVQLVDEAGSVVEHPFLRIGQEFWSRDMQRLTIILDPGRIKEGVAPNMQAGAPLDESSRYELVINTGFEDAYGRAISDITRKSFTVIAADHTSPNPGLWTLSAPQVGTQEPLIVTLGGMIDPILAQRLIRVEDNRHNRVEGAMTFDEHERTLSFTPSQQWASGNYRVAVHPTLEDYAGNRVESLFDMEAGTVAELESTVAERELIYRSFKIP